MNILYLADAHSSHTKKFVDYFIGKGHEVSVFSLSSGDIDGARVQSLNIKNESGLSSFKKFFLYYSKIGKLKKFINEVKPDIIHAHYASSYGMLARLSGKKYILSVWGSDVYDFPNENILKKHLIKKNLKKASVILSTSKDMKLVAKKFTDKEIIVTPFGVDINEYRPMEVEKISDFTVGTIKAFYKKYGFDYLIEGYKGFLDETGADSKLILAGKGPDFDEIVKKVLDLGIKDKVIFPGFINKEEVIKTFNQMDVAVFPSVLDSESFGVAAVEAGACGVCQIVSNVGGLPEATNPGVSSILVPKENSNAIKEALVKLYKDRSLLEKMSTEARKYVEDNYNIEDNFAVIEKIYNNFNKFQNKKELE